MSGATSFCQKALQRGRNHVMARRGKARNGRDDLEERLDRGDNAQGDDDRLVGPPG